MTATWNKPSADTDAPAASTGLFGGTFNPIHCGHLRAAEEIRDALGLKRILFIPSATPPHKRGSDERERLAPAALRLAWVRNAIVGNPGFDADPFEIERGGPSYTADSLRHYREKLAPARPLLILGWDSFASIGQWHQPEKIFEMADIAVMTRPPVLPSSFEGTLPEILRRRVTLNATGDLARPNFADGWVRLIPITALDISSSEIRQRLREGRSVRYLLPDSISQDVADCAVYRANDKDEL